MYCGYFRLLFLVGLCFPSTIITREVVLTFLTKNLLFFMLPELSTCSWGRDEVELPFGYPLLFNMWHNKTGTTPLIFHFLPRLTLSNLNAPCIQHGQEEERERESEWEEKPTTVVSRHLRKTLWNFNPTTVCFHSFLLTFKRRNL